jgi:hypothetical protein
MGKDIQKYKTDEDHGKGDHDHPHLHEGFHTHNVPLNTASKATPFIITVSLCFHSIFEGNFNFDIIC